MKTMSVGDFKTHFSEVLDEVKAGEEIEILYGRVKAPVARLVPIKASRKKRLLGALQGRVSFEIADDWKMTQEEFVSL
jgi:antitoxin (DNA-binding transcriptional repressor) of toxin-antitoxin stability system